MEIEIKTHCPQCSANQTVLVDSIAYANWRGGMLITYAFPTMTADTREAITTGICSTCRQKNIEDAESAYKAEEAQARTAFETAYGQVWDTDQLREDFEVKGFSMGICVVRRKSDNQLGSLDFNHAPRFYFSFTPHTD